MSRPFPEMDYYASFPVFTGIPEAKDTGTEYGNHPLATGPYMFEDYKPGTSLTLVKNPNWDPATDPGRIQSVDTWVFKFGEDTAKLENTILSDAARARRRSRTTTSPRRRTSGSRRSPRSAWSPAPRRARTCGTST